jgi:hypothetical protein
VDHKNHLDLILKKWDWSATLRGMPWEDDERKPVENDEIQVTLRKPEPPSVQVFVAVRMLKSRILHLQLGQEWEQFKDWMDHEYPNQR